ncbi:uncharacterized protein YcbK (DUF882 family) [Sphingomonas jejuensis]|uniref:Murein endopeptidase K n=1 Tax=Sphingomonas jejuensis TaxID=904715 RepID=A0ABX0XKB0_9SPHN|nr:DUF882 domain-containing protein [Sphingomonas jejuensis]NJC33170.1 uncharacterized protein YcbK (DUF882 family) [Sphingomonas jejuensis]
MVVAAPTATALVSSPSPLPRPQPRVSPPLLPERRLALRNLHNDERCDACWLRGGALHPEGLAEIDHAMRDWRTGEMMEMDRGLIRLLSDLHDELDLAPTRGFNLISGYRSPGTNAALRARGGAHTGVATRSQHMLGKAADIAVDGVSTERLRDAALGLGRGGVGYYPADGFVHVDTGRVRRW